MIKHLRLEKFRGFGLLEMRDLKRVNLILGQNNAGKTSLLEAIYLSCAPKQVDELASLFRARQGDQVLRYFRWLVNDNSVGGARIDSTGENYQNSVRIQRPPFDAAAIQGWQLVHSSPLLRMALSPGFTFRGCRAISVRQRDAKDLVVSVGNAVRQRFGEETLQSVVKEVDPRISKVRVDPSSDGNQVIVDIGLSELLPISQVGEGIYRLVTILAEIIGHSPEIILIDELENGLHHSIHEQVWTGLAATAEKLNVQIFATTHSAELFLAADRAFKKRPSYDFGVIQLFRLEKETQGKVLDREHIQAAIDGEIELR